MSDEQFATLLAAIKANTAALGAIEEAILALKAAPPSKPPSSRKGGGR